MSACTDSCRAIQDCRRCGRRKAPVGRSVPLPMARSLCDDDCPGYRQEPQPGHLWSSEELPCPAQQT